MEKKVLTAYERTGFRKSAAKKLRREGKIPAIIYGSHEPAAISLDAHQFHNEFHSMSENTIITIQAGGKSWDVLIKDFQENLIRDDIQHVDFYEIEAGKLLKTHIPVHLEGTPPGVKEGGILEHRLHSLEVECLPKDITDYFTVDVSGLNLGESIHVSEMNIGEEFRVLNMPEQTVVSIAVPKAEVVEEEEVDEEAEEMAAEEQAEGEESKEAEE